MYRVSTMTVTASVGVSALDPKTVFEGISISDGPYGVAYCAFSPPRQEGKDRVLLTRGSYAPRRNKRRPRVLFGNQITAVIRPDGDNSYLVNCKLFSNGCVQMAGPRSHADAATCLETIAGLLEPFCAEGVTPAVSNYVVRLINTDFCVDFPINNSVLYSLLSREYGFFSSYERCIYPGVKILYMYNEDNGLKDGVCRCAGGCRGKGTGAGVGECKRICVSVFQSGCVIVTGAVNDEQIHESHACVRRILTDRQAEVRHTDTSIIKRPRPRPQAAIRGKPRCGEDPRP
jgi:TATA-box binding protein (TBP) (component of TFIID and TFIIIB)